MYDEKYCIILQDKIYSQRTSHSKFIEFDLNGIKQNTYETLPIEIKKIINENEELEKNPDQYIEYKNMGTYIKIEGIYNFNSFYIKIPSHINNLPVKELGQEIFSEIDDIIKQVHLPNTIDTLNPYTFLSCDKLESVILSKSIKEIPHHCFSFCKKLSNIDLSNIEIINNSGFQDCMSLKNITLNKIKEIKEYGFVNCNKLEKIFIKSTLNKISKSTFSHCYKLKEVILPDTIKKIEQAAFYKCKELEIINFPKDLKLIEEWAFFETKLKNIVFNKNLKTIKKGAFDSIDNLSVQIHSETIYNSRTFSKNTKISTIYDNFLER